MASKNGNTAAKDAISMLEEDHERVRGLLGQLEESTPRGVKKRTDLLMKVAKEIRTHARLEEEIFYPAFEQAAKTQEDRKLYFEAAEEHGLVDLLLPTIEELEPTSELFGAKAKVLKDLVEHHAEEEEESMFPRCRKLFSREQLMELGEEMRERKKSLEGELESGRGAARGRAGANRETEAEESAVGQSNAMRATRRVDA